MNTSSASLINTAIEAAKEAGRVLKTYFQFSSLERKLKDDKSIATQADEEAEKIIIEIIENAYPDHAILAEESGHQDTGSQYLWIVDPLDGTQNFVNGIPIFATSIAVVKNNEPIASVIFNPVTSSLFAAEKGSGAFWNDQRIKVSSQKADAGMITIGTSAKPEDKDLVRRCFFHARDYFKSVRYLGSAALELCYLARGGTEGFINIGTSKWDYGAGALLVLEAGGTLTDFHGNPWNFCQNYFLSSNGVVHHALLELLKTALDKTEN